MPKEARVALFEDDEGMIRRLTRLIKPPHEVVSISRTFQEAQEVIPQFGEKEINVVIADGSLTYKVPGTQQGKQLMIKVRNQWPNVWVIGNSASGAIDGADLNLRKDDEQLLGINQTLTAL